GRTGFEQQPRHGGDGRKRFAAKAEGGDGEQVLDVAQFAGGVALESEQRVVAEHPAAVVDDPDQAAAPGLDVDAKVGGAGVERVFEQLFDDGSGPFDHFAGRDLVGDLVGENADAAHDGEVTITITGRASSTVSNDASLCDNSPSAKKG